jgi:hypothetical protein
MEDIRRHPVKCREGQRQENVKLAEEWGRGGDIVEAKCKPQLMSVRKLIYAIQHKQKYLARVQLILNYIGNNLPISLLRTASIRKVEHFHCLLTYLSYWPPSLQIYETVF